MHWHYAVRTCVHVHTHVHTPYAHTTTGTLFGQQEQAVARKLERLKASNVVQKQPCKNYNIEI